MFTHNGKISTRQIYLLLILQMLNMTVLVLPKIAAQYARQDGYILPILAIFFGFIYTYVITRLMCYFKGCTFVELNKRIMPVGIAGVLSVLFMIKLIITTGLEIRMFSEMISQVMLPRTPISVIVLAMLLTCSYLVKSGIEAVARMAEVLLYLIFVPLIIVMTFVFVQADFRQLMPFFQTGPSQMIKGGWVVSLSFMPLEFLLMLMGLAQRPLEIRRAANKAIIIVAIIQVILIGLTFATIGHQASNNHIWPVLTLMQSIHVSGAFIENQQVLMMTTWIFSVFVYMSSGVYFSSLVGSRLKGFKRENICVLPLIPIIYFVSIFPDSLSTVYKYFINVQLYFGMTFLLIIPLILGEISKRRKVGATYE